MFVKEPKLGFVKTRLAKTCGNKFTLALYQCFVEDLICTLKNKKYDFKLCGYPKLDIINTKFGNFNNFSQVKGDLGVKMQKAFESQFDNEYEKIVLIGSDTPHITGEIMDEAFSQLENNEVVIGPAQDGGYYLIAFNKTTFYEEVFHDILWSSDKVLHQTLQKLHEKKVYLLNELNDIDVLEDLNTFYSAYHNSYFKDSNTMRYLQGNLSWKNLT